MKTNSLTKILSAAAVVAMISASSSVFAQVKVGNNPATINPSAALEVESTNKGFLPPRVALQNRTDVVTIPTPAAGLMVYNTGTTGLPDAGIYFWDGAKWVSTKTEGGADSNGSFKVGESRTGLIVIPASTFFTGTGTANGGGVGGTLKTWMSGVNTTISVDAKLLSEAKGTTAGFPVFAGLRMDFSSFGYAGRQFPAPKLVNISSNNITYSVSSLSTINALTDGGKHIIVPGAVSWKVDGNDGVLLDQNSSYEYDNVLICIHKGDGTHEFYIATWSLMWVDTDIIGTMTVTRYF